MLFRSNCPCLLDLYIFWQGPFLSGEQRGITFTCIYVDQVIYKSDRCCNLTLISNNVEKSLDLFIRRWLLMANLDSRASWKKLTSKMIVSEIRQLRGLLYNS